MSYRFHEAKKAAVGDYALNMYGISFSDSLVRIVQIEQWPSGVKGTNDLKSSTRHKLPCQTGDLSTELKIFLEIKFKQNFSSLHPSE